MKRPAASKRLSADNLARLGVERLADLLIEVSASESLWKRRLRMELAAEVGSGDLAAEIDKRLVTHAAGRGRISWRKRPDLIRDLLSLRQMIVERLAPMDPTAGLGLLVAWFSLFPNLVARVRDPREELLAMFLLTGPDLGAVASAAHAAGGLNGVEAADIIGEAVRAQEAAWSRWLEAAGDALDPELAAALLRELRADGGPVPPRQRAVVRALADASGDPDAWLAALPETERQTPRAGAEIAARLLIAKRPAEARAALEAARPRSTPARWSVGRDAPAPPEPSLAWDLANIAVLEAEGRPEEAQQARWALFERDLSDHALREYIARLPDFEDVIALDKAFAHAAAYPRFMAALEFLMDWPAPREAAALVESRLSEMVWTSPKLADWAARLEQRFPETAALLLPAR